MKSMSKVKKVVKSILKNGYKAKHDKSPVSSFHSEEYLRHNSRRLEHLSSLRIPVSGLKVLELGSGIGDHSHYYIDRNCTITITEARTSNLKYLRKRYPGYDIRFINMEDPPNSIKDTPFDIVHCYGFLYHLSNPELALEFISSHNNSLLFLETCVSFGEDKEINILKEEKNDFTQSYSGTGCRPTRPWIFNKLQEFYEYVYIPRTQPNHNEFPLDWNTPEKHQSNLARAVFIASRNELNDDLFVPFLLSDQERHP